MVTEPVTGPEQGFSGRDGELLSFRLFLRWRPMLQRWAFRLGQPGLERPGQNRPNAHDNAPR